MKKRTSATAERSAAQSGDAPAGDAGASLFWNTLAEFVRRGQRTQAAVDDATAMQLYRLGAKDGRERKRKSRK